MENPTLPTINPSRRSPTEAIRKFCFYFLCFLLGGSLYYAIEILYRGYSHVGMWLCGGLCVLTIALFEVKARKRIPLPLRALFDALIITGFEFLFGCILNLWLGLGVWDYSHLPLHLLGQICLPFTLIWYLLSYPAIWLCHIAGRAVRYHLSEEEPLLR